MRFATPAPYDNMVKFDLNRWKSHIGCINKPTKNSLSYEILMRAHGIEKGITMPTFRLGFGLEKIPLIAKAMSSYLEKGGAVESFEYQAGVRILKEYLAVHEKAGYELSSEIISLINSAVEMSHEVASHQKEVTREEFFAHKLSDFAQFSESRHTIRNFAGPADRESIREAIAIAINAPSACNRQYVKAHLYEGKEITEKMRNLQLGTNGFGHLAEQVILITADMNALMWMHERHDLWNNAGLFLMNLCHALHYKEIGCCICAWSVTPEQDKAMHTIAEIPDSEVITTMLLIGQVPEKFHIACSPRKSISQVLIEH